MLMIFANSDLLFKQKNWVRVASSTFGFLRGGDGAGEFKAKPGAGRIVRGEVEGLADGAARFASGKRERRHDEVRRAGGDDGVRDGERRAAAGARVAQREVRVADVHDGEGVRHRRRRRLFAEVERQRRTKCLRGGQGGDGENSCGCKKDMYLSHG